MMSADSDGILVLVAIAHSFAELLFAILSRYMVQTASLSYGPHVPDRCLDADIAKAAGNKRVA